MCGIFGYIGTKPAAPILLEGLRTLEYRGYDSAGIFIPGHGVIKAAGPISSLEKKITSDIEGSVGIAHTRWATHGVPSEKNAHPHHDMSGRIWLVHNGIIENFRELKEGLTAQGITFYSDTDTEVLVKLIGSFYKNDILAATRAALKVVRGTYGLAIMSEHEPERIIVARMGSPIVLGLGKEGNFISSDPSALLVHTKQVVYLDDGELASVTKDGYEVATILGERKNKVAETVAWEQESVQKNGYAHFMLKEMFEAPEVIENTLRGRLNLEDGTAKLGGFESVAIRLKNMQRLHIIGCGSAYYAGQVGRYMLEEYAHLPVEVELGSEYRYKKSYPDKKAAALFVSQSGETADTRASLEKAKSMDMLTLGMINVVGSAIARETEAGIYNHAGPEVAVASTKAYLSQLTAFALVTLYLGRQRGMTIEDGKEIVKALRALPDTMRAVLARNDEIAKVAKKYAHYRDFMYIGRTFHAPIAYEGALKLKEVSYIHAEAYAGGELKHGPIAMLDKDFPVFAIAPQNEVYEKMVSNIEEVRARLAPVIALATEGDLHISAVSDDVIYMPKVHPLLQPIVSVLPLQLFAYHVGVAKGLNVDRPRNLAKSVTVE
jgi:glucosamine--fructose-6-phosphate aminotransferase (isomerizing)